MRQVTESKPRKGVRLGIWYMLDHTCWGRVGFFSHGVSPSDYLVNIGCATICVRNCAGCWERKSNLDPVHVRVLARLLKRGWG